MNILSPLKKIKNVAKNYKRNLRKKHTLEKLGLNNEDIYFYPKKTYKSDRKYSVVSAVYGVEKYIDDMVASLLRQTLDFKNSIQVILVDDGSVDGSAEKCKAWALKYPDNIIYLRKENGGQASARNYGMPYANGEWITFIDPDDLVDKNYFLNIDKALDSEQNIDDLHLISCNFINYQEKQQTTADNHPLRYRYQRGLRIVSFDENCDDIQLHVNSALFNREKLIESKVEFKNIKPSSEDLHFVSKYFLKLANARVMFLPRAIYWYRKRADNTSALDTSWLHPGRYSDTLSDSYLDLLNTCDSMGVSAPRWLQRTIIYDLSWHFSRFLNNQKNANLIPLELRSGYKALLKTILQKLDPELIRSFELAKLNDRIKFAILSFRDPTTEENTGVWQSAFDKSKNELCLHYYFVKNDPNINVFTPLKQIASSSKKIRTHTMLGDVIFYEYIGWFPWDNNDELSIAFGVEENKLFVKKLNKNGILRQFSVKSNSKHTNHLPAKIYIKLSKSVLYKKRFENAWLFIDRDTQADDNAEHLYRYVKENHPAVNAWFILKKDSHDWNRLSEEGFRMIAFGSIAHKMALLNAKHLISSHADHYITSYLPRRHYNDLMQWKYTFLQHGVIKDDLSAWLNSKKIDNFITTTDEEYHSICTQTNSYKFTQKEVSLTGLPRHDRLLKLSNNNTVASKTILIMPTWRQNITGSTVGASTERTYNDNFKKTPFFENWYELLHSIALKKLSARYGYKIVFFPHAYLQPYLSDFDAPHIEVLGHDKTKSIQDLFLSSAMMITDYSSVAFEMGFLNKPVLYYQFDEDEVFNGGHTTEKGYFEYRRDGFGPVASSKKELIKNLEELLQNNLTLGKTYTERSEKTFKFRDGNSCSRVYDSILKLN